MESIIVRLLEATAWRMERPAPYSAFHLVLLWAGIPLAFFAAKAAGKSFRSRPAACVRLLFFCGLLLAVIELYKQLFLYWIVNDGCYDWWYFPFQLCSVPMYLCLLLPLASQRLRPVFCTFIQDFGLLGGVMALLEPSGLMHSYWTLTLHGFFWHFMLIFLGLFCAFASLSFPEIRSFPRIIPLFAACCVSAHIINVASHPLGNADMFYISPYYPNGQIVFHQIALKLGITAGNLIYLAGVLAGGMAVHLLVSIFRGRAFKGLQQS